MTTATLLALSVLLQDPHAEPLDPQRSAKELYQEVKARYRDATALHLRGSLVTRTHGPLGEPLEWGGEFELRASRPLHGWMRYEGTRRESGAYWAFIRGGNWQVVADGWRVDELDLERQLWRKLDPSRWSLLSRFPLPPPILCWSGSENAVYFDDQPEFLPADPDQPELRGLRVGDARYGNELWIDREGRIVRAVHVEGHSSADPMAERTELVFTLVEILERSDPATYATSIPEGFAEAPPRPPRRRRIEDRFPIGAGVPDVELTTLDGVRIRPRDLRGRVVLFNFWFDS
jgi:hypothetical protein